MDFLRVMLPNIQLYLWLAAVVLVASGVLAITDWIRLRRAARRIDSACKRLWLDSHVHRRSGHYVVELDSLRKLAPPDLPEARLRRIHQEILRLND
jgi:hypothetical protein